MRRRRFLRSLSGSIAALALGDDVRAALAGGPPAPGGPGIDRRARVRRHDPVVRGIEPLSPLSLGNGGFAFTADATGLQTFPEEYREIPLATQAEWGWHSFPNPAHYRLEDALVPWDTRGRPAPYASAQEGAAGQWLRQNPHRISLARIGFVFRDRAGRPLTANALTNVGQRLDLWSGTLESVFRMDGALLRVLTWVHPERDLLAVRVQGFSLDPAHLALRIAFPYASGVHTGDPADWARPNLHHTELVRRGRGAAIWRRTQDEDGYWAQAAWSQNGQLSIEAEHAYLLEPSPGSGVFELVVGFSPAQPAGALPGVEDVRRASASHWERFWSTGGAVDLSGSADPRASELERRIVLSEQLTAIQCAGSLPPQETGETFDSWYGKFHLEMHWWHAAHFALWGREALLERSLPWYRAILPAARETARAQGYAGARWPKMVGPDGRESPSSIGVFLIWQQPHPIYLAELVYRARPEPAVLEAYREVVFESAEFMASYARMEDGRYVLGPPLIPAQEIHPPGSTFNPTFELAYWAFGLETAQRWRERLGLGREPGWELVLRHLSALPVRDGLYVNAESAPQTFTDPAQRRDHPTLLGAFGFIPGAGVDRATMRRTLLRVRESWDWETTWGWDYPLVAMTAARLGEPELALDALLMDTSRNRYLPNGHNYQRPDLTIYLPGNGGLLSAIAMMAAGWDGGPASAAPGFPSRGWTVSAEGLRRMV